MSQFVGHDDHYPLFVPLRTFLVVEDQVPHQVGNQAPVLHCPNWKVGDAHVICEDFEFPINFEAVLS